MADRSMVFIRVGGALPAADLPALLDALDDEGVGPDWERVSRDELEAIVAEATLDRCCVELSGHDVTGGQFERLEAWLRAHDLTYYRYDNGCTGVWSANGAFWRPGMADPVEWVVDDIGRPHLCYSDVLTMPAEELRDLTAMMREAAEFELEFRIEAEPLSLSINATASIA